jgi:hypothetical protein
LTRSEDKKDDDEDETMSLCLRLFFLLNLLEHLFFSSVLDSFLANTDEKTNGMKERLEETGTKMGQRTRQAEV